jgi:predicted site-specific integrase-resolvase
MHNGSDLITAKEKADELGISRATLSRRVRDGLIVPAFKDESNPRNGVQLFEREPVSA